MAILRDFCGLYFSPNPRLSGEGKSSLLCKGPTFKLLVVFENIPISHMQWYIFSFISWSNQQFGPIQILLLLLSFGDLFCVKVCASWNYLNSWKIHCSLSVFAYTRRQRIRLKKILLIFFEWNNYMQSWYTSLKHFGPIQNTEWEI